MGLIEVELVDIILPFFVLTLIMKFIKIAFSTKKSSSGLAIIDWTESRVAVLLFLFCTVIMTSLPVILHLPTVFIKGQSVFFRSWLLVATVLTLVITITERPLLYSSHLSSALRILTLMPGKIIRYVCKYHFSNQLNSKQHAKPWGRAFSVLILDSVWELGHCPPSPSPEPHRFHNRDFCDYLKKLNINICLPAFLLLSNLLSYPNLQGCHGLCNGRDQIRKTPLI